MKNRALEQHSFRHYISDYNGKYTGKYSLYIIKFVIFSFLIILKVFLEI